MEKKIESINQSLKTTLSTSEVQAWISTANGKLDAWIPAEAGAWTAQGGSSALTGAQPSYLSLFWAPILCTYQIFWSRAQLWQLSLFWEHLVISRHTVWLSWLWKGRREARDAARVHSAQVPIPKTSTGLRWKSARSYKGRSCHKENVSRQISTFIL